MTLMIASPFMSFAAGEESFGAAGDIKGGSEAAAAADESETTPPEKRTEASSAEDSEATEQNSHEPSSSAQSIKDSNAGDSDNSDNKKESGASDAGAASDRLPIESNGPTEPTEVTVVDSVVELSEESDAAYDNEAFFTIDAAKETTSADLATEEVSSDVEDILAGGDSASKKQSEIVDALEDSGLYSAEESGKSKVDVTSKFAYQRLRLVAPQEEEINAYGASGAVYFEDSYLLSYDSMEAAKQAYEALVSEHGNDAVFIDMPVKLSAVEKGWGTSFMGMSSRKTLAENGGQVTVAVIDTGIQKSHPVFSGRTILSGIDFVNNDSDPADDNGHGTAVSGIITESTPSNVSILPIKAIDANGEGSLVDIVNAVRYAEEHGADIINMSLGGYMDKASDMEYYDGQFSRYNALIVCAAGNENENMDAPGVMEFPGELRSTVCVSSITANKARSSFSNYGQAVDFAAPGSSVMLAMPGGSYGIGSGTSFSSPYIAAAAALVKAGHEDFSNEHIVSYLESITEDLGDAGRDVYFGSGSPRFPAEEAAHRGGSLSGQGIVTTISDIKNRTYNGSAQTQDLRVITNGKVLEQGSDYEIQYQNNVNAGTAGLTIIGKGDYSGEIKGTTFTIYRKSITPSVKLSGTSFGYTGGTRTPGVIVKDGSRTLVGGKDYTVSYSNNVNAGTASVKVSCKGNYSGSATSSFRIVKKKITPTVKLSRTWYTWNNRVQTPTVAVYDGGKKLPASQYSISYSKGRKNVGTYNVKVTMKGNYAGTRTVSYKILPKGTGISGIAGAKRAVKVRWSKQSAKMSTSVISGYQVQIATDSKFKKVIKTATFRGYNNTYNSIKKLAAGRRYYVRVRTYKTVAKKNYYSGWSKVRTVRTR